MLIKKTHKKKYSSVSESICRIARVCQREDKKLILSNCRASVLMQRLNYYYHGSCVYDIFCNAHCTSIIP